MHPKGSHLGSARIQTPRNSPIFFLSHPQQAGFDLSQQHVRSQVGSSTNWRHPLNISYCRFFIKNKISDILRSNVRHEQAQGSISDIAASVENELFKHAASKEEFMNQHTLLQRVRTELYKRRTDSQQQVHSSISYKTMHNPTVNATDRCAVAMNNNKNGFPNGPFIPSIVNEPVFPPHKGLASNLATQHANSLATDNRHGFQNGMFNHSIVHKPVFPPHENLSITTHTGMDELSQIFAAGGGRNLADSTESIGFSFPEQLANNLASDSRHGFSNGLLNHSIVNEPVYPPHQGSASTIYTGMDELSQIFTSGGGINLTASSRSTGLHTESLALHTEMGKSLQSESSNLMIPQHVSRGNSEVSNLFPGMSSNSSLGRQPMYLQQSLKQNGKSTTVQTSSPIVDQGQNSCQMSGKKTLELPRLPTRPINGAPSGNSEAMLRPAKRLKMESKTLELPRLPTRPINGAPSGNSEAMLRPAKRFKMASKTLELPRLPTRPINGAPSGNSEAILWTPKMSQPLAIKNNVTDETFGQTSRNESITSKRLEDGPTSEESDLRGHDTVDSSNLETATRFDSSMDTLCSDPIASDIEHRHGKTGVSDCILEEFKSPMHDSMETAATSKSETTLSKGLQADLISEESGPTEHDNGDSSNIKETEVRSSSSMDTLSEGPIAAHVEDINGRTGFHLAGMNAENKVREPQADEKMETKFSNAEVNIVSLTEFFTRNEIIEHIASLRKLAVQSLPGEETGIAAYKCQLCTMGKLSFASVPIYCLCCGKRIRRNTNYYHKRLEESDRTTCFCTLCYKKSRGGHITFNAISVPKTLLVARKNDEQLDEGWVECSKCGKWQHEICALYNKKRDLDSSAVYICPICRLKEIEEGMHVPLPKSAIFGAKNLPSTMLSNHIEKRLFKRLMQEKVDWEKFDGTMNLDEVLAAENLSVKVVSSVDKELKVKKQFLDIFPEQNYPAEFSYRSKAILLFQQIDGADVCLFAMFVQEFGSECGNPNQRCVYISYLDSVKYFRPRRETVGGEALRTFVYHEILIGYLDFCKKRGFTTCYIWACPPTKGEDYILYCHPDTQKTPKNDKLRQWYLSMLRKAAKENIVVGLSNIYDHFFVPTGKCDSKVTASRLPYFDGDYWSTRAMDIAWNIDKESGGEYEKAMNNQVSKRALKAMGRENPSKDTAKDILVMQRLGQNIFPFKENFIIVHLQHTCLHCQEAIVSGKRWFCAECKNFQECERCHTSDSHTSTSGQKHRLRQVLMEDIAFDTKDDDIILDNQLFDNRHNILNFCQKNQLQFDTLRRAKYSSMMILHQLKSHAQLTVGTLCSICGEQSDALQDSWKCEICPEFTACSACYKDRGAECHAHKLSQINSTSPSVSSNEESEQKPRLIRELLEVLQHVSQCYNNSSKTEPCSYPNCLKMKMLLSHAGTCTVHASGGCQPCKKAQMVLATHLKTCRVSQCRIPCCTTLKKRKWTELQSESRHIAAVVERKHRKLADP